MSPEPRRLHRAAIGAYALNALREAAVPVLVLFAIGLLRGGLDASSLLRGLVYAGIGTAIAAVLGYVRWVTTTWWVTEEAVHLRSGLLSTKQTDVPLSRIQSLDLEQGLVQRLFGVHAVHVQTAGGGARGEIVLEAAGAGDIAGLRALVGGVAVEERAPEAVRRLDAGMLLVAALTSGQLGVILPALAGLGQLMDNFVGDGEDAVQLLPDRLSEWLLAAAVLLAAAWLLSVLGAVIGFAGFTLARDGDRLRIRRGLVQRREATVPVARVRAVEVVEGVLRRPFGLASLRMEVIGHADEPAVAQTLFPLVRRSEVRTLLDGLLPELADDLDRLEAPPRRSLRRYMLPPAAFVGVVAVGVWAFTPVGPWGLIAVVPAALYGMARWRAAGWRLEGERLVVRSLRLARRTLLAPAGRRESHALVQTELQRRVALADVEVAFGKSAAAQVRHLEEAVAAGLFDRLSRI